MFSFNVSSIIRHSGHFDGPFLAENFFGTFAAIIEAHAMIQQVRIVTTNE